jgi:hypothetical protein
LGSYYTSTTISGPTANGQIVGTITIGSPGIYIVNVICQLFLVSPSTVSGAALGILGNIGFSTVFGGVAGYQTANGSFIVTVTTTYSAPIALAGSYNVGSINPNGITFTYSYVRIA